MSTFIGQLIGFAVIVFLLWKYVVPPVRTMMKNQQETVRTQLEDHSVAEKKVADADKEHAKALEEAKAEAAKVIDEARHDAEKIAEQLRAQADVELERIKVQGGQQVQLLRQQLIRELRQTLGAESVRRASDLVSDFVSDPSEQSATVDRFLTELDEMAPSKTGFGNAATAKLRAASRDSVLNVVEHFDGVVADLESDAFTGLANDLASAAKLLRTEAVLARHVADPSSDTGAKVQLTERLLSGKVSDAALDILKTAVSQRWSSTADLIYGVQHIARLALLVRAERDGQIEDVEDQLFRFSRILESEPQLITLLERLQFAARRANQLAQQRASSPCEQEHRRPAAPVDRAAARGACRRDRSRLGESGGVAARRGRRTRPRCRRRSARRRRTDSPSCSAASTVTPCHFSSMWIQSCSAA